MALIVTKGISSNGLTAYLIDGTAYTDPARNTLAVLGYFVHKTIAGDVEIPASAYDVETEDQIPVDVEDLDGVILGYLFAVPKQVGTAGADGHIFYDLNDATLKKKISGSAQEITLASLIGEVTIQNGSAYLLITTAISIKRDVLELEKLSVLEEWIADECEYDEYLKACREYDYVRTLRAASFIEFAREEYTIAQQNLETANSYADTVIARIEAEV